MSKATMLMWKLQQKFSNYTSLIITLIFFLIINYLQYLTHNNNSELSNESGKN